MRNLIRTWARYSLISLSSMEQDVSSTSIDSMPRSVFAASASASLAAWRQLSDETPTRSMVFTTAMGPPLSPLHSNDPATPPSENGRSTGGIVRIVAFPPGGGRTFPPYRWEIAPDPGHRSG